MGVTLGCARCHNHKFDPFTQKEFYQMFAYFNQVPERGNAFKYGNSPPVIVAPLPDQEARLKSVEQRLAAAEQRASALEPQIGRRRPLGSVACVGRRAVDWAASRAMAVHLPLDRRLEWRHHARPAAFGEISVPDGKRSGGRPRLLYGKAGWKDGEPRYGAGPRAQAGEFDGKRYIDVGNVGNFGFYDAFTISAWIDPAAPSGTIVSRAPTMKRGRAGAWF